MLKTPSYTPQDYPHSKNMREVFGDALEELALPYPSFKLPDWKAFNQMTGGFRLREFSILCGSTGGGKTTFLANMSAQLLKCGVKHFVMSVETGHTDYMKRILSCLESRDLNTGDPIPVEELKRITVRQLDIIQAGNIEFSLYDNRIPVEQLMDDIRYMVEHKGCKLALMDNLNFFMEVTSAANQVVEMDRVIHELIIFCKQVDVHLLMVMHPKKTLNGRVDSEFDIKGSSTAVQEAHNVFLFNRPTEESLKSGLRSANQRELKLSKMRRRGGYVGKTIVFESVGTQYVEKGFA